MTKVKECSFSAVLGLITGALGVYIMGYVAAISVPKSVFEWFEGNFSLFIGMVALEVTFQFLAFGILGILSGWLIGKFLKTDWRINALIYYSFYLLYLTVGISLFYKTQIQAPFSFSYLKQTIGLPYMVLPCCVVLMSYFTSKRITNV